MGIWKIETQIMQLKVSLKYTVPAVWRRLLMRSDSTLKDLHDAIQISMGWEDCHMHSFDFGDTVFGSPEIEELDMADENAITLFELFRHAKREVYYTYDFGDSWEHKIFLEKVGPVEPGAVYPQCIDGERACPPEDCGGYPGYEQICELMANPKLPDPQGLREWVGRKYDPEHFDLNKTNRALMPKPKRATRKGTRRKK